MTWQRGYLVAGLALLACAVGWLSNSLFQDADATGVRQPNGPPQLPLHTTLTALAGDDVFVGPIDTKDEPVVQQRYLHFVWPNLPDDQQIVERRMLAFYWAAVADIDATAPNVRYKRVTIWLDDDKRDVGGGQQVCVLRSDGGKLPKPDDWSWKWRHRPSRPTDDDLDRFYALKGALEAADCGNDVLQGNDEACRADVTRQVAAELGVELRELDRSWWRVWLYKQGGPVSDQTVEAMLGE
jgi:hypothetical protein